MQKTSLTTKLGDVNLKTYVFWGGVVLVAWLVYMAGIGYSPGYFVDESGLSYNAYLVSTTGAGEFGPRFPLYFQLFTGGFTQYSNPTQIYLLAGLFFFTGPSILAARIMAATSVFAACMLLGFLANRMTGSRMIGLIIAVMAMISPWLFEVGRLVLETFFYPVSLVILLLAVWQASRRDSWSWGNSVAIVAGLVLLTYSYTIGRLLGPLLAFGLVFLITDRQRLISVAKTWGLYALSMIPLLVYLRQNPGVTTRFYLLSYIKPESTWGDIAANFVKRYFEDVNPYILLTRGDINPRHHIPDAYGSLYFAAVGLVVIGIVVAVVRCRRESYWRFALWGLLAAYVPGAMTIDTNHTLRMIAVPVFFILFTIPAVEWLLGKRAIVAASEDDGEPAGGIEKDKRFVVAKQVVLSVLMIALCLEAAYFHKQYYQRASLRGYVFDAAYKDAYDVAVAEPSRPIYLVDGYWGPAYIHARWYAALEGRSQDEFVHQQYGVPPPANVIVISSDRACTACQMIERKGDYIVYRTTGP